MVSGTELTSIVRIMSAIVVITAAGCDPGVTPLSKEDTNREARAQKEDALRAQVALDVSAIVAGIMAAEGLRLAWVRSEP
jgi:hypothetical protein